MQAEARDDVFCHLISCRAVARVVLHLAINAMLQEALDSLGGMLIAYLERMGKGLAYLVESSSRSSTHCHVVDALWAIELCTSLWLNRTCGIFNCKSQQQIVDCFC